MEDLDHGPPLMIKDTRLARSYSVIEIASIAAGCVGQTPDFRINDAIELLSAAERHAFAGKWQKHRQWAISEGQSGNIEAEKIFVEGNAHRHKKAQDICKNAKRDTKTGKILRSSLVGLAYSEAGIGYDENHASRLYNDWLRESMIEDAGVIPHEELIDSLGPQPWNERKIDRWMEMVNERKAVADINAFRKRYESGTRTILIHDEETAIDLVFGFLEWLEKRPTKPASTNPRSKQADSKGQYVSPKNRGSARVEDERKGKLGSYKSKKASVLPEHEVLIQKRRKSNRVS